MTGKLITAFTDATAVTSDDRFLGLDGSSTKLHRPNDIGKYVAGRLGVYNVLDYGAVGDGVTDDAAAIQAALDAAAAAGAAGQMAGVDIPPGVYICAGKLDVGSNTKVTNRGHLKFTGGNAIGGFVTLRQVQNVELTGGLWDSNNQQNDNTIALTFYDADDVTPGAYVDNVRIHHLTVANSKHGGSHIADITAPGDIGRGGGKGITVQHGCRRVFIDNVLFDTCELGFSVEGKSTDSADATEVEITNCVVKDARYMGCFLFGGNDEPSGSTMAVQMSNITFLDCASGQTSEGSPQDVANLFGVINCQTANGVQARGIRIRNSSGIITALRGAHRYCNWDLQVLANNVKDVINTAPHGGYNPQNSTSRYNYTRVSVVINGATLSGYLVNHNATYNSPYSTFDIDVFHGNSGAPAGLSSAKYAANHPSTSTLRLADVWSGRTIVTNDGASLTGSVSGVLSYINGVGFDDDSGNNLSKIAPTRSSLALADSTGASQLLIQSGNVSANNKLSFARSTLTIATGAVTVTKSRHFLDTEAAAATDDLDTINGGSDGQTLTLSAVNAARVVTVKNNTGNIRLAGSDFVLDSPLDQLLLIFDSTQSKWCEISRSSNA